MDPILTDPVDFIDRNLRNEALVEFVFVFDAGNRLPVEEGAGVFASEGSRIAVRPVRVASLHSTQDRRFLPFKL